MEVRNGRTTVLIDPATGSIRRVADATGRTHFDSSHGRLFRVLVPTPDWSSHHADSQLSTPQIERDGDGVRIWFPELATPHAVSGIEAAVIVQPANTDEVTFQLRITNGSPLALTDVLFPWLAGWRAPDVGTGELLLGGVRSADPRDYPKARGHTLGRWHQRDYWTYPRDIYCPWLDIGGPSGGVGLISYQDRATILGIFAENLAGYGPGLDLSVGTMSFPRIAPGTTWESPIFGVSVHDDDWRATSDRYRTWVDGWLARPPTPVWARRAIGVQNVLFTAQDGTPYRTYAEIPAAAASGLRYGVPHLTVWDGPLGGPDPTYYAEWLGARDIDWEQLRAGLHDARRLGAHLSVIQNYRIVRPDSELFRTVARNELALRLDGTPYVEEYEYSGWHGIFEAQHVGPHVHTLDPRAPGYRQRVLEHIERTLDIGFDSFHWDQPHMHWPSYRTDSVGAQTDDVHAATIDLVAAAREIIRARDPEGMMVGEWGDVFGSAAVDLWFSWAEDIADIERAAYSLPQAMWSCVVDSDPAAATRAFGFGAQLFLITHGLSETLDAEPVFAGHVARLADLKARSEDRVAFGSFRAHHGLGVTADDGVTAALMTSPGGPCVILAAPGPGGRVEVELDRAALGTPDMAAGRVLRFDGQTVEHRGDRLSLDLAPNEAAVWLV